MDQINPEILDKIDRMEDLPQSVKHYFKEILTTESGIMDKNSKIEAYNKIINRYYDEPAVLEWSKREALEL